MENSARSALNKFIVPVTIMLSFVSFWRAAAIVLSDLGSSAYYVGGIAEKAIGKPADYAQKKRDEYTEKNYHKVSDEIKQDWDLSGAVEDARLLLEVGAWVADVKELPHWKPGSEFRARREAMLKAAKP